MVKHKCENFIKDNVCTKCRRPFDTLGKKNPFKIGDIVTPIWRYTYHGRKCRINHQFNEEDFQLIILEGKDMGMTIERYAWWELKNRKEVMAIPPNNKLLGILA